MGGENRGGESGEGNQGRGFRRGAASGTPGLGCGEGVEGKGLHHLGGLIQQTHIKGLPLQHWQPR